MWYATNRKPNESRLKSIGYSSMRDSTLHYGKVFVSVPADYLERLRDSTWYKRLIFGSPESSLRVDPPLPMAEQAFLDDIKEEFARLDRDERTAVVYIHGFSTTFLEGVQRAASIGYQLKVPVMGLFSWPSIGNATDYRPDLDAVSISADNLATFLIQFAERSGASRVHVIAHSMGNYGLLQAILRPAMQSAMRRKLKFGQIILAAPDVDRDLFLRDAAMYLKVARRVTLYASQNDYALKLSRDFAKHPRAGFLPPATLLNGIDTIDVSRVDLTFLGHSYVADQISVLQDMHTLIAHDKPPGKRVGLRPAPDGTYWVLN